MIRQSQNAYQPDLFAQQGYPDAGWGQQQQMQPQYTSYNMMQQQQQEEYMRQQMAMQEQQRQQEEYMRQQQFLQQQHTSLLPQQTGYGSNNPFAFGGNQSQQPQQPQQQASFLPVPVVTQQPSPQQVQKPLEPQQTARPAFTAPKKDDGEHSGLAALLARGREDGLDTFGNVGNMRIPVGSQFHGSNRVAVQQTGAQGFGANNPFGQMQQSQQRSEQPFFSI
ncbi:uncharacterized protein IL334_005401 [Kwoniella shivajii]|uniref:Uncharacterized protein n=1 Tax=Kwoniella shivajii TaxID=564305 RepID=A0ABZ1D324_9TREE|nr:hypothetical protein IL334_005401 [Kwoniella shivajii]